MVRAAALFICFAGGVSAQTIWIVDINNGPGTHFTNVAPAVAAAASGDIIIVRPGAYEGAFSTSKGLTILAESEPFQIFTNGAGPVVQISNLPAQSAFVLADANVCNTTSAIRISNCLGRVHLQNVANCGILFQFFATPVGLTVQGSSDVTVANGRFGGSPGVRVISSHVTFAQGVIAGSDSLIGPTGPTTPSIGLTITTNSTVALSQCSVSGGKGQVVRFVVTPGKSAISVGSGSRTIITGPPGTAIVAGADGGQAFGAGPIHAITTTSADTTVMVDPEVTLQGQNGGAAFSGPGSFTQRQIVSLAASGGTLGGTVTADVVSPAGDLIAVFVGMPTLPVASVFGSVLLDLPTAIALVFAAPQPASEVTQIGFAVPNDPVLKGFVLGFQAANFYQASSAIEMSNTSVLVLR
jgi:hypothetical protein